LQAEASFHEGTNAPTSYAVLARVSPGYPPLPGRLPTCYSPVRRSPAAEAAFAHDLHVLSTPPAFILSQDQTLQFESFAARGRLGLKRLVSEFSPTPPSGGASWKFKPLALFLCLVFKEPAPFKANSNPTAASRPCQAPGRLPPRDDRWRCRLGLARGGPWGPSRVAEHTASLRPCQPPLGGVEGK
jgi:hypothetical protein